jgi:hypothetical protein
MNNLGTSLVKITMFAGGAVLGSLLARWLEEVMTRRVEKRSDFDKTRYEQGLAPVVITPVENKEE